MINVCRYENTDKTEWNDFIKSSKNGTFLFSRDYMEYHAERFTDCSMIFRDDDGKLIAVMPANLSGETLVSHGGLTFGGVVSGNRMKTPTMLAVFEGLIGFSRKNALLRIVYKVVPHIYHAQPAEEDLYALFRYNAQLVRRDISTTIYLKERLSLSKGRKWAAGQSRKNKIEVRESDDFETFIRLESELLAEKYNAVPVHTAAEMQLLASRFPDNIKLFGAFRQSEMLAGIIVYESKTVAHTQYIAANNEGKKLCALDGILQYLITSHYAEKRYFDFGISTEQQGKYLNTGLIDFKESWGGRAIAYDFYELNIK
ncbi:MAG: GNAT family N-acetyltransferase [Acidobacteriota bacterium]|nr:GNAT family N-acetyltransferase [Acidobacteriota bacterium]